MIDAQTVGKASVRVCALAGTQVGPSRDAGSQTLQILQLPELFVCFLLPSWEGVGRQKELSRNLGHKGQVLVFQDGAKGPKACLWWCRDAALEGVTASYQLCCWVAQTGSA